MAVISYVSVSELSGFHSGTWRQDLSRNDLSRFVGTLACRRETPAMMFLFDGVLVFLHLAVVEMKPVVSVIGLPPLLRL